MEQRKHIDFIGALCFMALSVYMIVEGISYHAQITQRLPLAFYESPGIFPVIIGSVMFLCSAMLLVRSLKGGAFKENIQKIIAGAKGLANKDTLFSVVGLAIMALYIFILLPFLGFVIGSVIFMVGLMLYLKSGHIIKIILISTAVVAISYVVVQIIFRAPLP